MLNRFWILAALAAVLAVGGVGNAQDKKKIDIKLPKDVSAKQLMTPKIMAALGETPRAIGIGAGGAAGINSSEALYKALEDLGLEMAKQQPSDARQVVVNQIPIVVFMTPDNGNILMALSLNLKDPASIPAGNLLGLMELTIPTRGVWHYESSAKAMQCWEHLDAKHATKAALHQRLQNLSTNIINGYELWKDIIAQ